MRVAICLLAFVAAAAYAEYCDHTSDCKLVACNPGFQLRCNRDNVCTCISQSRTFNCSMPAECDHAFSRCSHGDHHWHCVDNRCVCRLPHD